MRRLLCALLALPLLATHPASAAGGDAFVGTATVNCFGCGASTGTASLTYPPGGINSATANYTVNSFPGSTCEVATIFNGAINGAVNRTFQWTLLGAVMVISELEDTRHFDGVGTFVIMAAGNPCGQTNLNAVVTGVTATAAP